MAYDQQKANEAFADALESKRALRDKVADLLWERRDLLATIDVLRARVRGLEGNYRMTIVDASYDIEQW